MSFPPSSNEEALKAIAKANTPRKQGAIKRAWHESQRFISQFNSGLINPRDMAKGMIDLWMMTDAEIRDD